MLKNKTVGYHNEFNYYKLPPMNEIQLNAFNLLLQKLKNHYQETIQISYGEFKESLEWTSTQSSLESQLESMAMKLLDIKFIFTRSAVKDISHAELVKQLKLRNCHLIRTTHKVQVKNFTDLRQQIPIGGFNFADGALYKNHQLVFKLSSFFKDYFINLKQDVTFYYLQDLIRIKGKYAKQLYRILAQFKNTGYLIIGKNTLYSLLNIPESYQRSGQIGSRILNPAMKSLRPYFNGLSYYSLKNRKTISSYVFKFQPKLIKSQPNKTKQVTSSKPSKDISSVDLPFE